jgi:hypothetical protein
LEVSVKAFLGLTGPRELAVVGDKQGVLALVQESGRIDHTVVVEIVETRREYGTVVFGRHEVAPFCWSWKRIVTQIG